MTLSRFAAVQWLSFLAVAALLLYLLSPILTPFVVAVILLAKLSHNMASYPASDMYRRP
jgi:predicted PurR-regulated permease PerM